ncbi:MAG: PepSY domain-containing protein [Neobacillus sp.]
MKNKLVVVAISIALVLGGAAAVGASKNYSSHNDFNGNKGATSTEPTFSLTEGQKVELENEHGQTFYKVESDHDDFVLNAGAVDLTILTLEEASKIATNTVSGSITEVEREMEHGRLEYKFEIESKNGQMEVRIDAQTGEVTRIEYDDNTDDSDD